VPRGCAAPGGFQRGNAAGAGPRQAGARQAVGAAARGRTAPSPLCGLRAGCCWVIGVRYWLAGPGRAGGGGDAAAGRGRRGRGPRTCAAPPSPGGLCAGALPPAESVGRAALCRRPRGQRRRRWRWRALGFLRGGQGRSRAPLWGAASTAARGGAAPGGAGARGLCVGRRARGAPRRPPRPSRRACAAARRAAAPRRAAWGAAPT
jgi:hypothetical protein